MAYQVHFTRLSFQEIDPEDPTVPVGDPVVLNKYEKVPAWVPEFQISALLNAGMIVPVAETPALVEPVTEIPPQVRTPDMPLVLPSDPNGVPPLLGDRPGEDVTTDEPDTVTPDAPAPDLAEPLPALPRPADNKETWENYAQRPQIGMSEGEAEAMNKTDLMAEVKRRYEAATK